MDYHYWTQPLPNSLGWYMAHLPAQVHRIEAFLALGVEAVLPLLMPFLHKAWARWACFVGFLGMQLVIGLTGNYGFFNLLTAALCILTLRDDDLRRLLPARLMPSTAPRRPAPFLAGLVVLLAAVPLAGLSVAQILRRAGGSGAVPQPVTRLLRTLRPFHAVNGYGLFAVMTTERPELLLEGSDDGVTWKPYRFRYKIERLDAAPPTIPPGHMPRLDWQMWFAALRGGNATWFHTLAARLLEGSPAVQELFAEDPFPDQPPRYLRARLARYEPAPIGASAWWTREDPRLLFEWQRKATKRNTVSGSPSGD